jgi:hypothetical protein
MNAKFEIKRNARRFAPGLLAIALVGAASASLAAPSDGLLTANIDVTAENGALNTSVGVSPGDTLPIVRSVIPAAVRRQLQQPYLAITNELGQVKQIGVASQIQVWTRGTTSPTTSGNLASGANVAGGLLAPIAVGGLGGGNAARAPLAPVTSLVGGLTGGLGGANPVGGLLAPVTGLGSGLTGGPNGANATNRPLAPITGLVGGLTGGLGGANAAGGLLAPVTALVSNVTGALHGANGSATGGTNGQAGLLAPVTGLVGGVLGGVTGVVGAPTTVASAANTGNTGGGGAVAGVNRSTAQTTTSANNGLIGGLLGGLASGLAGRR